MILSNPPEDFEEKDVKEGYDSVQKVHVFTCRADHETVWFQYEWDEKHPWKEDGYSELMCDCDRAGEGMKRWSQMPLSRFREMTGGKNSPAALGTQLLPREERGWSPFLNKHLMTTGDVREYDKNHPNMEYAHGEDIQKHRDPKLKKEWRRIKERRRKAKEDQPPERRNQ